MIGWEKHHFSPHVTLLSAIIAFLGYGPLPPPPTSFAGQLKAARVAANLTRRQLAAQVGVHMATLAEWERGEVRPSKDRSQQLANLLGVSC